jgi:hypothetical protein
VWKASLTALLLVPVLLAGLAVFPIRPRPPAAVVARAALRGVVTDENGPLSGARVRFKARPESTLTDAEGRFTLPPIEDPGVRVTAWKEGYYIGGVAASAGPLQIRLRRLPLGDSERYRWTDPRPDPQVEKPCGNCHAQIYEEWWGSPHAHSATNPRFLNLYDGSDATGRPHVGWNLMAEYPDGVGVCTNCHAPSVSPGDPAYFDLRQARGTDALGVHCDICHKVRDVYLPTPGLTHGRDGLALLRPLDEPLFFGPLDDADQRADTYAPIYRHSLYCAPCHEGIVFGVHVYSTYSEWLTSPQATAGQHCQACHMTPSGTLRNIAPGQGGVPRDPATLAGHTELGERGDRLRRCLQLEVRVQRDATRVRVDISVSLTGVGHRLPTGYIDRQLILLVDAHDRNGALVDLSAGPRLPAIVGSWAGHPGRLFAKQPQGFDGQSPVPFWRARPEMADTRLAPDQPDETQYWFAEPAEAVRIRLLYRRFWEQVTQQKSWARDDILIFDRTVRAEDPRRQKSHLVDRPVVRSAVAEAGVDP